MQRSHSYSQCSTTQPVSGVCSGSVANNFNSGAQGFPNPNGSFIQQNSRFEQAVPNQQTGATTAFTSPAYTKTSAMPGAVTAGLLLIAGSNTTVTSVTLEVLDAGTNAVISSCTPTFASLNNGSTTICISISDPTDLTTGRLIKYRFTFTFTSAGGNDASRLLAVDDFSYGNSNAPLPVKFANVKASKKAGGIEVSFSNLTESDVVNYSIERSANGQDFTSIKALAATKNDGGKADYSFTDAEPLSGNNLYRIKSVETNGKVSYSAIARVDLNAKGLALTIAPNPTKATELGLQITDLPAGNYKIRIFNNNAQVVGEQLLKHSGGSFSQTLPLNKLQAGMYYLELNGAVKMQKQFIVQ